ncbi:MAG TPA: hypothetical protein VNB64_13410, partial [Solirubrobacteraceae bacterium]|nr:hypothetical protein [Solirubrobacteraceae bacterium]
MRSVDDVTHVVVVRTLGAPERRRLRKPRPRAVGPEPAPEPVATCSVTVVYAPEVAAPEAGEWLSEAGEDRLDEALVV